MRATIILLLFAAMLPAAIRSTSVGAMMWAWVALAAPTQYAYGIAAEIPYNKIAVGVTVLSLLFGKTRNRFFVDRNLIVLTLFLLVCMIAFAVGLSENNRTYDLADRFVKIYILCLVMMACLQNRLQVHGMLLAICLGAGVHGVLEGLKFAATGGGHIVLGPAVFGDNNTFGLAILMVIPLLLYCYRYAANLLVRYALLGATAINLIAVVATASRGALIGLVAVGIGIAVRSKRRGSALAVMAVCGCLIVVLAPDRWSQRMDTISTAESDSSFTSRLVSWKLHTVMAIERPLTGGGFSALEDRKVFEAYRFKINTVLPFFVVEVPQIAYAAHSIYFQSLGDNGFPGLVLFVALIFIAFANLRAIRRMARGHEHLAWAYDLANTFWVVMIAYVVAGAALSMAYFELYYMVITLIAVVRKLVSDDPAVKAAVQQHSREAAGTRVGVPQMARAADIGSRA